MQYDMFKKHLLYMQIESFKEYILIDSAKMNVLTKFKEEGPLWTSQERTLADQNLLIETIGLKIPLKEIYKNVIF